MEHVQSYYVSYMYIQLLWLNLKFSFEEGVFFIELICNLIKVQLLRAFFSVIFTCTILSKIFSLVK